MKIRVEITEVSTYDREIDVVKGGYVNESIWQSISESERVFKVVEIMGEIENTPSTLIENLGICPDTDYEVKITPVK